MSEVQQLHFYTTGEGYTNLLVDFFQSGEFKLFEDLLGDGNLNHEQKLMAFRLQMKLEGDTRNGDLSCTFEKEADDFNTTLYYAIKTAMRGILNDEFQEIEDIYDMCTSDNEQRSVKEQKRLDKMAPIFKYFTVDELLQRCGKIALRENGYEITEFPTVAEGRTINGVILKDGSFIECGCQDHVNLFPVLYRLGLSDASDWTRSEEVLHISSSSLNGKAAYTFQPDSYRGRNAEKKITPEQVATCWKLRKWISDVYGTMGSNTSMANCTRNWVVDTEKMGGKFGNLVFLNKYFPHVKTPRFSKELGDFEKDAMIFMRTSPDKSLPGLLNSRKIKANQHDATIARNFMQLEFEKVKDLRDDNELHWFFQEFLEGPNGVCHIRREPNSSSEEFTFSYMVSNQQGDIVQGISSQDRLEANRERDLRYIAYNLFKTLECDGLQLEFVIHDDEVFIVQLRELVNEFEKGLGGGAPPQAFVRGKSFSSGGTEINVDDILVIESDGASELLLGKKALIVTGDVEFSHLLALSKALRIPSMYATGPVDFKGLTKVYFSSRLKEAYVNKS